MRFPQKGLTGDSMERVFKQKRAADSFAKKQRAKGLYASVYAEPIDSQASTKRARARWRYVVQYDTGRSLMNSSKGKRLMASGSKKLAAWVREQGKRKNPRAPRNGYTVHPGNDNYAGLATAKKAAKAEAKRSGYARVENQDTGKTVATYGGSRSNPRHTGVKLPRTGHTGFLKASAVDVITRGGRVVEVKVKR